MRLHISLDDDLVAALDRRAGKRERSAYIAECLRRTLDDEQRWDDIESALGAAPDFARHLGDDAAEIVRTQRRSDPRRSG